MKSQKISHPIDPPEPSVPIDPSDGGVQIPHSSEKQVSEFKPSPKHSAPLSRRDKLLKRKRGGVHPKSVAEYLPLARLRIPEPNHRDAYGLLTDESTYSDYAWAFLRRNRFYQQYVDSCPERQDLKFWGYRSSDEYEPDLGLMKVKHYKSDPKDGEPIKWRGVHSFIEQFEVKPKRGPSSTLNIEVEWPDTQVAIVFDIDPVFGQQTTAIDIQIEIARRYLRERAVKENFSSPTKRTRPPKWLLRAQLRIADLHSSPRSLSMAKQINSVGEVVVPSSFQKEILAKERLTLADIAELLPKFDLEKSTTAKNEPGIEKPIERILLPGQRSQQEKKKKFDRASSLSILAWDNIYNWRFMNWLQFDAWDEIHPMPANDGAIRVVAEATQSK